PFLTLSLHEGAALQTLFVHSALTQSRARKQARPLTQGTHVPPPQSTSVSPPFFTASAHEGAAQVAFTHTPLRQSPPPMHACPVWHLGQVLPPQSMSVSAPS